MTDTTEGAVKLARDFAKEKAYTSVTSTLCYGVQWDAIMQFMDNRYIEGVCTETSYVRNSEGKGNYFNTEFIQTGANENYKIKNIYDMAGNAIEWTMEVYENGKGRVLRGGSKYSLSGDVIPVSCRGYSEPMGTADGAAGFRIFLYIK